MTGRIGQNINPQESGGRLRQSNYNWSMSIAPDTLSIDYYRVEQALSYLQTNFTRQPSLAEIAASIHLSEFHFQRLFIRWVGISPKRFLQYLTKENAKELLANSRSLLDVSLQLGLSGPSRLHDLFITCEAVTPGEFKQRGAGLTIHYGYHHTPFGDCLLALTDRGLCGLAFAESGGTETLLADLRQRWGQAKLIADPAATAPYAARIFALVSDPGGPPLQLYLSGTNFQLKVWQALLHIPTGELTTYGQIAALLGKPTASRAVGNAVGDNPIAYLIPCHRVIRQAGELGGYRYGLARKQAILGWEQAHL
jgi:AraC family transcriptional regulator of adaptative response/methylated-DNA-[protein]-cysteine methyltransferase